MKPKLLLCLVLVLSGGLFGCFATAPCSDQNRLSDLPLRYHNAKYDFTFSLPASWRGYSVLIQQWNGQTYSVARDTVLTTEHGAKFVLRHPQWSATYPYQDIPILVFTRGQWEADKQGKFSVGAGGFDEEIAHNAKYVFAISSRFDANDSVKGWQEANDIVTRNRTANEPHLHPE